MSERIDYISVCITCQTTVEHVTGIPDPYWRHVTPQPHPARPDRDQAQEVTR